MRFEGMGRVVAKSAPSLVTNSTTIRACAQQSAGQHYYSSKNLNAFLAKRITHPINRKKEPPKHIRRIDWVTAIVPIKREEFVTYIT